MKIIECIQPSGEKSYDIKIEQTDDLNAEEIAECFKKQYPNLMAVVSFAMVKVEMGFFFIFSKKMLRSIK